MSMTDWPKVAVVGVGHLADATCECCSKQCLIVSVSEADLVWFCVDTPVSDDDTPNVDYVMDWLRIVLPETRPGVPVLISSQVPVGFCARVEMEFPTHTLAIQPENIRKAHAVDDFADQERMIVGMRRIKAYPVIERVLLQFTDRILLM